MTAFIGRREFITLLGGAAAAWPLAARAQQPAMPVIGFLSSSSPRAMRHCRRCVPQGPERKRLCRGPERRDRIPLGGRSIRSLPALAADLVRRQVAVIVAARHTPRRIAAKAATTTIPIVFISGGDPVKCGLVASLNRPGGNVTGVSLFTSELGGQAAGAAARAGSRSRRVAAAASIRTIRVRAIESTDVRRRRARSSGSKSRLERQHRAREIDAAFATARAASGPTRCSSAPIRSSPAGATARGAGGAPCASRRSTTSANLPRPAA